MLSAITIAIAITPVPTYQKVLDELNALEAIDYHHYEYLVYNHLLTEPYVSEKSTTFSSQFSKTYREVEQYFRRYNYLDTTEHYYFVLPTHYFVPTKNSTVEELFQLYTEPDTIIMGYPCDSLNVKHAFEEIRQKNKTFELDTIPKVIRSSLVKHYLKDDSKLIKGVFKSKSIEHKYDDLPHVVDGPMTRLGHPNDIEAPMALYLYGLDGNDVTYLRSNYEIGTCFKRDTFSMAVSFLDIFFPESYEALIQRHEGRTEYFSSILMFWDDIKDMNIARAKNHFKRLIETENKSLSLFGISIYVDAAFYACPIFMFVLVSYLLAYLIQVRTKMENEDDMTLDTPWLPLFKDALSRDITRIMIYALPFVANVLLLFQARGYSDSILVGGFITVIILVVSSYNLKYIKEIREKL